MAVKTLEILQSGDPISATWLNKLRWLVWANRVTVARDCGLTLDEGFGGKVIGFRPDPTVWLGITTSVIPARAAKVIGFGTVQPYVLVGTTMTLVGVPVSVGNWTGTDVPTNVWVKYILVNKAYMVNGQDCSGVAP